MLVFLSAGIIVTEVMISHWFDQKLGLAPTMPTMMTDKVTIMAMAILMALCYPNLD